MQINKSLSLNHLVSKSQADWVCVLDCDDKWDFQKLEIQHNTRLTISENVGVVGTCTQYFGDLYDTPDIPYGYIPQGFTLTLNPIINSSCMIKKTLAKWDSCYYEDYDLWLNLDLNKKTIFYNVDCSLKPLCWHLIHSHSAFNTISPEISSRVCELLKLKNNFNTDEYNELVNSITKSHIEKKRS